MVRIGKRNRRSDLIQLFVGVSIIILLNIIGSFVFHRFDLTSEKRYSLSPATKALLKNLDDIVYIKVYLEGDFPAGFKRLQNETREMLDEFRVYANDNNLQYEFIDPSADPDRKKTTDIYKQLAEQGLKPTTIHVKEKSGSSQKIIFPGAIFTYKNRSLPLQLLKSQAGAPPEQMLNISVQGLEYEISNTIRKLSTVIKPRVGFLQGHGELEENDVMDISKSLSEYYTVEEVRIDGKLNALAGLRALVIAKPDSAFSENDKFIIDQFVMKGGRVLWLVENVHASMDSLQRGLTVGLPIATNLDDQLFKYGARINTNLVQDLQAAAIPIVTGYVGNQPQQSLFPWYYFPLAVADSKHPIVNNLNAVKFEFANTIDTVGNKNVKKTILLHTSKYTKVLNAPVRISLSIVQHEPKTEQYNKPFQPLAVLLEGKFESVFKNRLPQEMVNNKDIGFTEVSGENKMIVISDGDVIRNDIQKTTGNIFPLGVDRYTRTEYGNKNFILNCMNYLCDESGLISVRSRNVELRMLDRARIESEGTKWKMFNIAAPIILLLGFGMIQYFVRKKKYTK